jgi:aconitate hydratase
MGILPMQFKAGESADTLGLDGHETFNIDMQGGNLSVGQDIKVTTNTGKSFNVICRLDTEPEIEYLKNGGILNYVLRKLM